MHDTKLLRSLLDTKRMHPRSCEALNRLLSECDR